MLFLQRVAKGHINKDFTLVYSTVPLCECCEVHVKLGAFIIGSKKFQDNGDEPVMDLHTSR